VGREKHTDGYKFMLAIVSRKNTKLCIYKSVFFFFFFPDVAELVLVSGTSLVCVRSGDLFATGAKACDIYFMTAWFVFGFLLACAYHHK
jgi:hypothetical protein